MLCCHDDKCPSLMLVNRCTASAHAALGAKYHLHAMLVHCACACSGLACGAVNRLQGVDGTIALL